MLKFLFRESYKYKRLPVWKTKCFFLVRSLTKFMFLSSSGDNAKILSLVANTIMFTVANLETLGPITLMLGEFVDGP